MDEDMDEDMDEEDLIFLDKAQDLYNNGQIDSALHLVYVQIDNTLRLCGDACEMINSFLNSIEVSHYNEDILIALLVATLPVKNHLPHRGDFFTKVSQEIESRGYDSSDVLDGLEEDV